jgi:hypothetical protein
MRRLLAIAYVLFVSFEVHADDTNDQNDITGGRSVVFGGAFTAIANDISGLLFNPAGIVDDKHSYFSFSANLYGFERTERGGTPAAPLPDLRNLSQMATELLVIPSTKSFFYIFVSSTVHFD